jgi:hypothetical protein
LASEAASRRIHVTADVRPPSLTPPWVAVTAEEKAEAGRGPVHTAA